MRIELGEKGQQEIERFNDSFREVVKLMSDYGPEILEAVRDLNKLIGVFLGRKVSYD